MERIFLLALVTMFGATGTGIAANKGSKDNPKEIKDSILVTATRFEKAAQESVWPVSAIREEALRADGSLAEALDGRAGVDVREFSGEGSLATLSNWGAYNRHMLLLYDGRVVKDYSLGGFNLSDFSAEEFTQVQVLKGPQSAIYGADAIGGVLNFITRSMLTDKLSIVSRAGSHALQEYRLDGSRSCGSIGVGGFLEYERTDNVRSNSGVRRNLMGARADYLSRDGRHAVSVSARYFTDSLGVPGPVPDPAMIPAHGSAEAYRLFDHQQDENYSADARYRFYDPTVGEGHVDFFWAKKNLEFNSLYQDFSGNDVRVTSIFNKRSMGVNGRFLREFRKVSLSGGVDWLSGSSRATETDVTDPGGSSSTAYNYWSGGQDQLDVWGSASKQIATALRGDLSGRLQFVHNRKTQPSYNVGLSVKLSEQVELRGGYGYAFRLPAFSEQFARDFFTVGNPRLSPETSRSLVGTVTGHTSDHRGEFRGTVFHQQTDSLIQYQFDLSTFKSTPVNVGLIRTTGLDLSTEYHWSSRFTLGVSAVYQHAEQRTNDTADFVNAFYVPEIKWRATVSGEASDRIGYSASIAYTSDRNITLFGGTPKTIDKVYELSGSLSLRLLSYVTVVLSGLDLTDQARPDQFGFSPTDGDYPSVGRRFFIRMQADIL